MSGKIKFETFVDAQSTAFQEYMSTITAKLPRTDKEYRAVRDRMEDIFQRHPRVAEMFGSEQAAALTEQECAAVIEVVGLQNQLVDIEMQAAYFRGCYDSLGYLKKAGIL